MSRLLNMFGAIGRTEGKQFRFALLMFALLFVVTIGLQPFAVRDDNIAPTFGGDLVRQAFYIGAFLLAVYFSRPLSEPASLLVLPISIVVALIWCWFSIAWSLAPGISARRLVLTTLLMFTIFRCVQALGYDRALAVMRILLLLTLALSYFAVAVFPTAVHRMAEIGDPNLAGNWRGVLMHKNFAGAVCAFTIIVFVFDTARLKLWLRVGALAAAGIFLYHTHSKTSVGILVLALSVGWIYSRYNPAYRLLLLPLVAIIASASILYFSQNWAAMVEPLNNPQALTGRAQIWPPLINYISNNPFLGAGFGAFWNIGPQSPIFQYADNWVVEQYNGHNGYLDAASQVGIPGAILIAWAMFVWPVCRLFTSQSVPRANGALAIAMILFCAGHNMTETSLFDRDMIVQQFLSFAVAFAFTLTSRKAPAKDKKPIRKPDSLATRRRLAERAQT